jgi:hypothetical protein
MLSQESVVKCVEEKSEGLSLSFSRSLSLTSTRFMIRQGHLLHCFNGTKLWKIMQIIHIGGKSEKKTYWQKCPCGNMEIIFLLEGYPLSVLPAREN